MCMATSPIHVNSGAACYPDKDIEKENKKKLFHYSHDAICSLQIIKDLVTLFPVIRDWIAEFLDENKDMTASMIGRNMLIEQVEQTF